MTVRWKSRDWAARIQRVSGRVRVSREGLVTNLDKLGMDSWSLLRRIELGEPYLSFAEVIAVALALNAPVEWITGDDENAPLPSSEEVELMRATFRRLRGMSV